MIEITKVPEEFFRWKYHNCKLKVPGLYNCRFYNPGTYESIRIVISVMSYNPGSFESTRIVITELELPKLYKLMYQDCLRM